MAAESPTARNPESQVAVLRDTDDAVIADQISAILVQLRQECPAAHVLRLNVAVSALEAAALGKSKNSASGGSESEDIVLVVLAPHSGP